MKHFKSAGHAQRFLSARDQINDLFHLRHDHVSATEHRASRTQRLLIRAEICSIGSGASLIRYWRRVPIPFTDSEIVGKFVMPSITTTRE